MVSIFKIKMGTAPGLKRLQGHRITDLFTSLDGDKSKAIDKEELRKFLELQRVDLSEEQVNDIYKTFADNGHLNEDDEIPYDTFISVLHVRLG